jgi:hypothetical protein
VGHLFILCCRPCGLACLKGALSRGREDDWAEITGSREGAKPRSSDEKRTIFRHEWAGPSGLAALSSGWAWLPSKRSYSGVQEASRAWESGLESNAFGSLLLLADNYNHTTNDPTTEAQSAQRTHRDFLAERSDAVLRLGDPCVQPAASPGSRRAVVAAGARVSAALVATACAPGRPGCGDVVRRSGLPGNRYARVCTRTRSHATEAVLRTIAGFGLGFQGVSEGF